MLLKLYINLLKISKGNFATWTLSLVAFWESILFPIPPDLILIPMSLANQKRAFFYAGLTTIFSVGGGIVGYLLGSLFWTEIGRQLTQSLGYGDSYNSFVTLFGEYGTLIIIIGALTPFPFKIIAILSGVMGYPFVSFFIAAGFSRGIRFYLIAGIIFVWGNQIDLFLQKYLGSILMIFTIMVIMVYLYFK